MVAPLGERREQMKLAVSTAYVAVMQDSDGIKH